MAALQAGAVRLADGRALAYAAHGARDGFPVVYLHGAIGSPLELSPELVATIDELGLRWLCVQRPGFGGSDPCPGRTIASWAGDVRELADALGLGRLAVLGVSAGGPYALACGHGLPGRVGAVAVCSSLSPLCPPHAVPGLPPHVRVALRAVRGRPATVTALLDAGLDALRRHPRLALRAMRSGAPATDRALLDDPQAGATAVAALLDATAGGVGGLVEDHLLTCRPWGFAPADVGVRVHLWHGLQDRLVPAEHAWQLAAALPDCRAAFDPDEGHFFFRRRVREIVGRLVAAARLSVPG